MQRLLREAAIPLIIASSLGASWLVTDVTKRVSSYRAERALEAIVTEPNPPPVVETPQAQPREPTPIQPTTPAQQPVRVQPPEPQPANPVPPVAEPEPRMLPPIVEYPRAQPREPTPPAPPTPQPVASVQPQPTQPTTPAPPVQQAPVQPQREEPAPQPRVQAPPREPSSQLEGIITAWQAATISRFTVIEPLVTEIAREFSVPPATIYGIILSESSAYPDALSRDGKRGLLQYDDHVFSAILDLNAYQREPLSDQRITRNAYDPETSLRAYRIQLRAYREYTGLTDPVSIHIIRGAEHDANTIDYLRTPTARDHRELIERRIREAESILRFTHNSNEYRALSSGHGSIRQRLEAHLDTMVQLTSETSAEYRNAYATNAVAYARILHSPRGHEAIELLRTENQTRARDLEHRLTTPLR